MSCIATNLPNSSLIKRKCGDGSVYHYEGCGMTLTEINATMPHTWIV